MPNRASWSIVKAAARLAALSPQSKFAIMIGGDAVFLPLCMLTSVAFRLGSIEGALAAVVLVASLLAWVFQLTLLPRSALPMFWFVAFAYVVTSRFIARALLRRGMKQSGRHRLRTAIYGAGAAARGR